jgi:hypothetical protein
VTIDVPAVPPKPETKPLTLPDPFELKSLVGAKFDHCGIAFSRQ